jgi:hypothetical protein
MTVGGARVHCQLVGFFRLAMFATKRYDEPRRPPLKRVRSIRVVLWNADALTAQSLINRDRKIASHLDPIFIGDGPLVRTAAGLPIAALSRP